MLIYFTSTYYYYYYQVKPYSTAHLEFVGIRSGADNFQVFHRYPNTSRSANYETYYFVFLFVWPKSPQFSLIIPLRPLQEKRPTLSVRPWGFQQDNQLRNGAIHACIISFGWNIIILHVIFSWAFGERIHIWCHGDPSRLSSWELIGLVLIRWCTRVDVPAAVLRPDQYITIVLFFVYVVDGFLVKRNNK